EGGFEPGWCFTLLLDGRHAELGEAADQRRILERLLQSIDKCVDDRLRRVARRINSVPGGDVELRHPGLRRSRYARQGGYPLLAGNGEAWNGAGANLRRLPHIWIGTAGD